MRDFILSEAHGEIALLTLNRPECLNAWHRPMRNNRTGRLEGAITADGVYRLVRAYSAQLGFEIGTPALRPPHR